MSGSEYLTDVVVVGSGGGLCGAVTAASHGLEALVIKKEPLLEGSTAVPCDEFARVLDDNHRPIPGL